MGADLRPDLDDALDAFGVPVVVTWADPENAPVTTTGIWGSAVEESEPYGSRRNRVEARRVMALPKDLITTLPDGTKVAAQPFGSGPVKYWKVDGLTRFDEEWWFAILVVDRQTP